MRRLLPILLLLLWSWSATAQFDFPVLGARNGSMGGCSTALDDLGAAPTNVAAWAWQSRAALGMSIRNTALLKQLSYGNLQLCLPTQRHGSFALTMDHFGTAAYYEQRTSLAYALAFHRLALGVRLDYLHSGTSHPLIDPLHRLSFAAGLQARITDRLLLGLRTTGGTSYNLGLSYLMADGLQGTTELEYQQQLRLRAGLEYGWQQTLFARIGIATRPAMYTFGLGYQLRHCHFDMTLQVVQPIGCSSMLSIHYIF